MEKPFRLRMKVHWSFYEKMHVFKSSISQCLLSDSSLMDHFTCCSKYARTRPKGYGRAATWNKYIAWGRILDNWWEKYSLTRPCTIEAASKDKGSIVRLLHIHANVSRMCQERLKGHWKNSFSWLRPCVRASRTYAHIPKQKMTLRQSRSS